MIDTRESDGVYVRDEINYLPCNITWMEWHQPQRQQHPLQVTIESTVTTSPSLSRVLITTCLPKRGIRLIPKIKGEIKGLPRAPAASAPAAANDFYFYFFSIALFIFFNVNERLTQDCTSSSIVM